MSDPSHVAEARRALALLGHADGSSPDLIARAALVATELCTNILKYARRGTISIAIGAPNCPVGAIDIVAVDKGPGIVDFESSSRDGHSTGGGLGIGIGTIRRAASVFDVYTLPALGTAIFVRMEDGKKDARGDRFLVGSRMVPMPGEHVCGDGWSWLPSGTMAAVSVVDGLGHGPKAAEASSRALAEVALHVWSRGPAPAVQAAHRALVSTRGAVMAIALIDAVAGSLRFVGVGNISGVVLGGQKPERLASIDGTVGFSLRPPREHLHPWHARSVLVMHSDGLSSKWTLAGHPGLLSCHPVLIAAVLYRDFTRHADDATVIVVKNG